jgi:hypothetical protein
MSGKIVSEVSQAITAAAGGLITVASTVGFYKTAIVWLSAAGQAGRRCIIAEVVSATQLRILFRDIVAGTAPTYGASNVAAYNGGLVVQHEQLVYNPNEVPLA